jgi:hypothetical protein
MNINLIIGFSLISGYLSDIYWKPGFIRSRTQVFR